MKTIEIRKKSGGVRVVCVPSAKVKRRLRKLIPDLQKIVRQVCDLTVVQGFAELRSCVTNAALHVGYQYTLSFDLASFFDTVTRARHGNYLRYLPVWNNGIARQGLPTSPIVANIAAAPMDTEIMAAFAVGGALNYEHNGVLCQNLFRYTRYADDLTFSFNDPTLIARLKDIIPKIAANHGFKINEKKTQLQCAKAGRRVITGVAVDDKGIYPTRRSRRKLRAAIHNAKLGIVKKFPRRQWSKYCKTCKYHNRPRMPKQEWLKKWLDERVRGLQEWCSLKMPGTGRRSAIRIAETYEAEQAMQQLAVRGTKC